MINIAIDGPAGAGKSSLSKLLAKELAYIYVDTGALYRAVGLKFSRMGFDTELKGDIDTILEDTMLDIRFIDGTQRVFLDGEDVSDDIRTPTASMMASAVSAKPVVREFLLGMQRKLAEKNNVVMDGRDIGTHILPNADVKVYLTASVAERARRRYLELQEKGVACDLDEIAHDIEERDTRDMNREIAPLRQAEDAAFVDSSNMSIDEVVQTIKNLCK